MPRTKRETSSLGIYHVMLRGINKQDIFFREDDFVRMMTILREVHFLKEKTTGKILSSDQCTIYAYCILNNHLHLLIHEGTLPLPDIMKKIEVSYAVYYNKKYQRDGHLFQGRFRSEPINDDDYFHTAFRYIARNPVKAQESATAEEYPYSSWNEYVGHDSNIIKVIKPDAIQYVIDKFLLSDLKDWINQDNDDKCLDIDNCSTLSDVEAWSVLSNICGLDNPESFRALDPQTQIYNLLKAIDNGVNVAQAARLGIVSRHQLMQAVKRKRGESSTKGSDPNVEESVENAGGGINSLGEIQEKIRHIQGMRKKTYQQFHQIAEFLNEHPSSKCQEIADFIKLSNERTRKHLVQLANENIVEIYGKGKNTVYLLKEGQGTGN